MVIRNRGIKVRVGDDGFYFDLGAMFIANEDLKIVKVDIVAVLAVRVRCLAISVRRREGENLV